MNDALMRAMLSMDAYNRGYGSAMDLGANSDVAGAQTGNATVIKNKGDAAAQSAGFYAVAYNWNGQKVIAYRGTDNPTLAPTLASDIWSGWTIGGGVYGASQAGLALQFYRDVTGQPAFNTALPSNTVLTGHSLGGRPPTYNARGLSL